MNQITGLPESPDTVIPITKGVAGTYAKAPYIGYATNENGSLYISNGQYIMKTNHEDFSDLIEQVNKRRRADPITAVEKPELLKYLGSDRGKFALSQEPLEFETEGNSFISLFADDKQYFGYDKKYLDVFNNGDNRLFVDDNAGYELLSHCLIVKDSADEIIGVVLPLELPDELYIEMAEVLPLKEGWKTELERIKANPTNDPYIGKEYSDGSDLHIISAIKQVGGDDMYVVPVIIDGKLSRGADYVKVDEIENQIARWETKRIERESENQDMPVEEESQPAQEEAKPPRPFTYLRKSPWGEVSACEKLCPGVFMVSAEEQGGIMVIRDMTAALSPAALKCGVKFNDYLCFEDNGAQDVALRELLDKKLWAIPRDGKDKAVFEENINKSLQERQLQYWRSRENRLTHTPPTKPAPVRDGR